MAHALPREVLDYQNPYTMATLQNSWIQSHFYNTVVEFIKLRIIWRDISILEYGCGSGRLLPDYWQTLIGSSGKLIGIDASSAMIDFARRMAGSEAKQVTFYSLQEDAADPSRIKNSSIHIAISCFVVAYIPKIGLETMFTIMHKRLQPMGKIVLVLAFSEAETVAGKKPIQLFSMHEWALPNNATRFGVAEWANVYPNTIEECFELVRKPLQDVKFDCSQPIYNLSEFSRNFNNLAQLEDFLQVTDSSTIRTPSLLKSHLSVDKRFIQEQCKLSYDGQDPMGPITIRWKFFTLMLQKEFEMGTA